MGETSVGIKVECSIVADGIDELAEKAKRLVDLLTEAGSVARELEEGIEMPVRLRVSGKEDSCTE